MKVCMDVETYTKIVNDIEKNSNDLLGLNDQGGYVEPDADCLLNVVVPDYKTAYENLIDVIRTVKTTNQKAVALMYTVKNNYVKKVDEEKNKQLKDNSQIICPGNVTESEK